MPDLLVTGPADPAATLVLAHGAGAPMDSPFMCAMAEGLDAKGIRVVRFEFAYMAARRDGVRKGPDREPALLAVWNEVIDAVGEAAQLFIGGKSMGGRMASKIADDRGVRGLVCLGYPFHPPGKPERLRTAHLAELRTPTLIVQGERDTLGCRDDVATYTLAGNIRCVWLPDGDHSFKPRKRSGHTEGENLAAAVAAVGDFVTAS